MIGDEKTHYEVLGVEPDATTQEIKKTARKLMQTHHPDLGGNQAIAAQINTALDVLSDPEKRAEYDHFLDTGGHEGATTPDPESFEDDWGTEDAWETIDEEEVLDVEVEESPLQTSESQPSEDLPFPNDQPQPKKPTEPQPSTKVRTALWQGFSIGFLPAMALVLGVLVQSYILTTPPMSPFVFPAAGMVVGLLFSSVFRHKLPDHPSPRNALAAMIATAIIVISLGFIAPSQPQLIPGAQALLATTVGTWLFLSGVKSHRLAERIIKSKGLSEDGTIYGPSTGDTAGELLNVTIFGCLTHPELHAARGFQTADDTNPFTKAILLGDRVALLRPMFIPPEVIPVPQPTMYWSQPSLFVTSPATGVPTPLLRLELGDYRSAFKQVAGELRVQEFIVVYTHPDSPKVQLPEPVPTMPSVISSHEAKTKILDFLLDADRPVHHIDHQAATGTLMGLEYQLMRS